MKLPATQFQQRPNQSAKDPLTGKLARLYAPRRRPWQYHFEWYGAVLTVRRQIGHARIAVLDIDDPHRVGVRQPLMDEGDWAED